MTSSRWHIANRGVGVARVISGVGGLFALIEIIYVLLIVLGANSSNGFFHFIARLAEPLALFFPGLFSFASHNLAVVVNYGLAAVFWLVVSGLVARVFAR